MTRFTGQTAWDELTGVPRDLPKPPRPPRRNRAARRIVVAGAVAAAIVLGVNSASSWARQAVLAVCQSVLSGDPARMAPDIDREALQAALRQNLGQMARLVSGAPPTDNAPGGLANAYLADLIEITVQGQADPERLARTLRVRAFGSEWSDAAPPFLLGAGTPRLQPGRIVLVDLPGDRQTYPSGIGLCFRLHVAAPPTLRLSTLIWPELRNDC